MKMGMSMKFNSLTDVYLKFHNEFNPIGSVLLKSDEISISGLNSKITFQYYFESEIIVINELQILIDRKEYSSYYSVFEKIIANHSKMHLNEIIRYDDFSDLLLFTNSSILSSAFLNNLKILIFFISHHENSLIHHHVQHQIQ